MSGVPAGLGRGSLGPGRAAGEGFGPRPAPRRLPVIPAPARPAVIGARSV